MQANPRPALNPAPASSPAPTMFHEKKGWRGASWLWPRFPLPQGWQWPSTQRSSSGWTRLPTTHAHPQRDIRAPAYGPSQQQWVPEGAWQQPTEAVAAGSPTPAALVFWLGRAGSASSSTGSAPAPPPVLRQQLLHLKRRTRQLIRHCERPKPVTSIPTCICEKHTHFS